MGWAIFSGCSGGSRSYPFSAVCFPVGGSHQSHQSHQSTSPKFEPATLAFTLLSTEQCLPESVGKVHTRPAVNTLTRPPAGIALVLELRWNFWDNIEIDFYSHVNFSVSHISKLWECFREEIAKKGCCSFGFCPNQGGGREGPAQIFLHLFWSIKGVYFLLNANYLNLKLFFDPQSKYSAFI